MALVRISNNRRRMGGRFVSVSKSGVFLFSKQLSESVIKEKGFALDFFQSDKVPGDWYFGFAKNGDFKLKLKSDNVTVSLNAKWLFSEILRSVDVDSVHLPERIKILVGPMTVVEEKQVYPLITASIKTQINQ